MRVFRSPYRGGYHSGGYYSRGGGGYRQDYNNRQENYHHPSGSGSTSDNRNYGDKEDGATGSSQRTGNEHAGPGATNPFGEVSRETMLHGSYTDYMREFQKQMQTVYPGFPGPFPPPVSRTFFIPPTGSHSKTLQISSIVKSLLSLIFQFFKGFFTRIKKLVLMGFGFSHRNFLLEVKFMTFNNICKMIMVESFLQSLLLIVVL